MSLEKKRLYTLYRLETIFYRNNLIWFSKQSTVCKTLDWDVVSIITVIVLYGSLAIELFPVI